MELTRRNFVLGAAAAGAAATTGCSLGSGAVDAEEVTPATDLDLDLTINYDEMESMSFGAEGLNIKVACLAIATIEGIFEEENLTVTMETVANVSDGITACSEGKLDVVPFGIIPTATFVAQGVDNLVIIGGTSAEGSECISLPENTGDYNSVEDFIGKKIGYYPAETGHIVMQGLMLDAGIDYETEMDWVAMDSTPATIEAVSKGELDCGFVNSGNGYIARQSGVDVALQVGTLKPDFPCCRQTAGKDALVNNTSALIKFEIAALRGYAIMKTDKERAIADIIEYCGQDYDYVENIIFGTDDYDACMVLNLDPYTDAVVDFYEVLRATGNLSDADTPYQISNYIDPRIYLTALDEMISRGENLDIFEELQELYRTHNTTSPVQI